MGSWVAPSKVGMYAFRQGVSQIICSRLESMLPSSGVNMKTASTKEFERSEENKIK